MSMDIQEAPLVLVPRVVLTEPILTMSGEPARHFYSIFDSILPVEFVYERCHDAQNSMLNGSAKPNQLFSGKNSKIFTSVLCPAEVCQLHVDIDDV